MSDALSPDEVRNIIALGKTGVGKSSTLNTLLGQKYFRSGHGDSVTTRCDSKVETIHGIKVRLIDTPGLSDTRGIDVPQAIDDYILDHTDGIHVFVLVLSVANKPTKEDIEAINQILKQLGPGLEGHLMIIVTHIDLLDDGETLEGFLQSYADKHPIVAECWKKGRVLGFDNSKHATSADKQKQLEHFATKTRALIKDNGKSFYSHAQLEKQKAVRKEEAARVEREREKLRENQERLETLERRNIYVLVGEVIVVLLIAFGANVLVSKGIAALIKALFSSSPTLCSVPSLSGPMTEVLHSFSPSLQMSRFSLDLLLNGGLKNSIPHFWKNLDHLDQVIRIFDMIKCGVFESAVGNSVRPTLSSILQASRGPLSSLAPRQLTPLQQIGQTFLASVSL